MPGHNLIISMIIPEYFFQKDWGDNINSFILHESVEIILAKVNIYISVIYMLKCTIKSSKDEISLV